MTDSSQNRVWAAAVAAPWTVLLALGLNASAPAATPEVRVLNNFVSELLNVRAQKREPEAAFEFTNPREGWVWVSSAVQGKQTVAIALDGEPLHTHQAAGTLESMRFLTKGGHRLTAKAAQQGSLDALMVRAIPELVYTKFGADPLVPEFGKYDWAFLKKHVLPNINVMVGGGGSEEAPYIKEWKGLGKRWIAECGVPGLSGGETVTADQAEQFWSQQVGMKEPLLDGVIADEFGGNGAAKYAAWTPALQRMGANAALKGRRFYPYYAGPPEPEPNRAFLKAVMDAGWPIAWEMYLPEPRDENPPEAKLDKYLRQPFTAWRRAMPGVEKHIIVCLGTFCLPPESLDLSPRTDYKVYLEKQMNLLASDPAFRGLYGVMTYLSCYTDEETVRWMGKLFRHYCIEGNTRPLSTDPYVLTHIRNPDFEDSLNGWAVDSAEPGSVAARKMDGFSTLQGRYPQTARGNTVLWMKRSPKRPNVVSQTIKELTPGRLYSLRMYSGDFQDLSIERKHAITIALNGAEVLPGKSFQHVFANCYSHHWGPFDDKHRGWMNYHWIIFRATRSEAGLRISDWSSDREPGGPAGQELMMNFVEVQPYDPD
jgi:hypothetical protein